MLDWIAKFKQYFAKSFIYKKCVTNAKMFGKLRVAYNF